MASLFFWPPDGRGFPRRGCDPTARSAIPPLDPPEVEIQWCGEIANTGFGRAWMEIYKKIRVVRDSDVNVETRAFFNEAGAIKNYYVDSKSGKRLSGDEVNTRRKEFAVQSFENFKKKYKKQYLRDYKRLGQINEKFATANPDVKFIQWPAPNEYAQWGIDSVLGGWAFNQWH